MTTTTRMQEPITLVRPAQTMLAMRYGGLDHNIDAMLRFLDGAQFDAGNMGTIGVDIILLPHVRFSVLGTVENERIIRPGTWAILDDARGELILASDDAILTTFTNLTD